MVHCLCWMNIVRRIHPYGQPTRAVYMFLSSEMLPITASLKLHPSSLSYPCSLRIDPLWSYFRSFVLFQRISKPSATWAFLPCNTGSHENGCFIGVSFKRYQISNEPHGGSLDPIIDLQFRHKHKKSTRPRDMSLALPFLFCLRRDCC